MPIPISTTVAVRQYLYTQLTATLAPDALNKQASLLVCYDEPGPDQPDDIVCVGKVNRSLNTSSLVGGGGAGWLEEKYSVEVVIEVYRGGDDPQGVYTRAATLTDSVISVVRSDPTLGGAVLLARPTTHVQDVSWDEAHAGRLSTSTLEIECYQRI